MGKFDAELLELLDEAFSADGCALVGELGAPGAPAAPAMVVPVDVTAFCAIRTLIAPIRW